MEFSAQGGFRPWIGCAALAALGLGIAAAVAHAGAADAASPALPPALARSLALQPREARTQLPDGAWLVLERDGSALKLVEDRVDGRALRRWPLAPPRRYASLSLLPSGRALLWGGVDANNRLHTGGLWFDPAARSLTPAYGLPLSPRAGHAASVLSDGRLLLTGGWTPAADAGARAELWDERSGIAAPAAQAPARLGHRSRVEADGRVRLSEGVDAQGRAQTRDQLYDPVRRAFAAADAARAAGAAVPRLSDSSPRDQDRDVATDARLSLRFSEPLRANELNASSVTLLGPHGFSAVRVTPAEAGRLLFVAPHQRLQANAQYSLLVDGAHARNGQALAPTLIDFVTGADAVKPANARSAAAAPANAAIAAPVSIPDAAPQRANAPAQRTAVAAAAPAAMNVRLSIDAAALTVNTSLADQPVKMEFSTNTASADLGLGIADLVVTGSSEAAVAKYFLPGQPPLSVPCAAANNGCGLDFPYLTRGTYSVVLYPPAGATLSFKASLSTDRAYSLPRLDTTTAVAITRRGQNARISFDASADTVLGVRVESQATTPAARAVVYSVIAPDRSVLVQKTVAGRAGLTRQRLPATGRYTVLIDPRYGEAASAQVSIGPSNMVPVDGDPLVRADVAAPSYLTYESDGQTELSIGLSGLSTSVGDALTLFASGSNATSCTIAYGRCRLVLGKPPAGVYVLEVRPQSNGSRFGYSAYLSGPKTVQVQRDQVADIAIDRPGQPARLQFDLAAGQALQLNLSAPAGAPAQARFDYTLSSPSGATIERRSGNGAQRFSTAQNAPPGRYTLTVDATRGETWNAQATLDDPYLNSPIDSGMVLLRTDAAGQTATLHFANPSPANIGIGITAATLTGANGPIQFKLKNAQGLLLSALECRPVAGADACEFDPPALPRGEYDLDVVPPAAASAMSVQLTFSTDLAASLSPSQPLHLRIPRRGQNARVAVAAQAGSNLNLSVQGQFTEPAGQLVAYTVVAPDGRVLASNSVGANGSGGISVRDLPSDGVYQVFVDPDQAAAVEAELTLIDDFSADLIANADPFDLETRLTGQSVRLNFQAAQGARLGLGVDRLEGVTIPLTVRVRDAGGTVIAARSCEALVGGCALDLDGVAAGAYVAELEPAAGQPPYRARVTLSNDLEHGLSYAEPYALDIRRWGQNARLWFNAEAGQHLTFAVTGHSHSGQPPGPLPAHRFAYTVYGPGGEPVVRGETEGDAFLRFGPLQTGGYSVRVDPLQGDPMSAQVRLDLNPDFGLLETDGPALRMATDHAGQALRFGFDIAADSALSLDVAAVAPVAGSGFELRVVRGNDPAIEIPCGEDALGCTLALNGLPAGRYQATLVDVETATPHAFAIDATLSTVHRGEATPGAPYPLQLRSGQPARLRLAGSSGQRLLLSVDGQATTPAAAEVVYLVRGPDGGVLDSARSSAAAFAKTLPALPADGDYQIEVAAAPGVAVQAQLRLDPAP